METSHKHTDAYWGPDTTQSGETVIPSDTSHLLVWDRRERQREAAEMGLTAEETEERERVRDQVLKLHYTDTPEVFRQRRAALEAWKCKHPEDPRLSNLFTLLADEESANKERALLQSAQKSAERRIDIVSDDDMLAEPVAKQISSEGFIAMMEAGDMLLDPVFSQVKVNGRISKLTSIELRLLAILLSNPGQIYSPQTLLQLVWRETSANPRLIARHIANLRAKIEENPRHPKRLLTVRPSGLMLGYMLLTEPPSGNASAYAAPA